MLDGEIFKHETHVIYTGVTTNRKTWLNTQPLLIVFSVEVFCKTGQD